MRNEWLEFNLKPFFVDVLALLNTISGQLAADAASSVLASGTSGSIATNTKTTVVAHTNGTGSTQIIKYIVATGDADGEWELDDSSTGVIDIREYRTSEQDRTLRIRPPGGIKLTAGATLTLRVTHYKSTARTFVGSIFGV